MDDGVVINPATIALFGVIIGPIISALVYIHKRLMEGEAEKLTKVSELAQDRYDDMKADRDFYRSQAEEKDTTQLEAILALREGIVAVRGTANDLNTIKTQLNILTDKIEQLSARSR